MFELLLDTKRRWRTALGAKKSYVVKGKMPLAIQMAERENGE